MKMMPNILGTWQLWHIFFENAQQRISGSGGYMPEDVEDVQKIMSCGKWDLKSIITHEFLLEELATAIRTASDIENAGNVVIRMKSC